MFKHNKSDWVRGVPLRERGGAMAGVGLWMSQWSVFLSVSHTSHVLSLSLSFNSPSTVHFYSSLYLSLWRKCIVADSPWKKSSNRSFPWRTPQLYLRNVIHLLNIIILWKTVCVVRLNAGDLQNGTARGYIIRLNNTTITKPLHY